MSLVRFLAAPLTMRLKSRFDSFSLLFSFDDFDILSPRIVLFIPKWPNFRSQLVLENRFPPRLSKTDIKKNLKIETIDGVIGVFRKIPGFSGDTLLGTNSFLFTNCAISCIVSVRRLLY